MLLGPCSSSSSVVRPTMRSIAVSQSVSTSSPSRRTSGRVSRSGELLACQPNRSLGSSRPWLTRSSARPRTPTIVPSLTAMSSPSPLLCRIDAEGTQRSTSSADSPSASWVSTRTGHGSPAPYGVRVPHGSVIRSIRRIVFLPLTVAGREQCGVAPVSPHVEAVWHGARVASSSLAVTLTGGPTLLLEVGGVRLLADPTFDPPGEYPLGGGRVLTKTEPAPL